MANQEITYSLIESLVINAEVEGRQVHCQFALPGSNEVSEASAVVKKERSMGSQVKKTVTRNVVNEVRRAASRMLRGLFGGGILGRTASQTVNTVSRGSAQGMANSVSKSEKEAAVVAAFKTVSNNFAYDATAGEWRKPSAVVADAPPATEPSPFNKQLQEAPVRTGFERDVLARLLARVAYADGELSSEELDFFKDSIPSDMGTIEELARKDEISNIEAEEVPAKVRETIYMLSWSISAIDMDVDDSEVALLHRYRDIFAIDGARASELEAMGKSNVLEGYLHESISREELFEMANKIGINNNDAERAKIAWMKRQ